MSDWASEGRDRERAKEVSQKEFVRRDRRYLVRSMTVFCRYTGLERTRLYIELARSDSST